MWADGVRSDRPYCYLSIDSIDEGVGASQVMRYAEGIASRGIPVELHTFEKRRPSVSLVEKVERSGIRWHPHRFGYPGVAGGLARVIRASTAVRGKPFVHARSDMAALAVMLAGVQEWTWDVRSLWVDQRIALGAVAEGSLVERVFRWVEKLAARRSSSVVVLAEEAIPVLQSRFGPDMASKVATVPTCVDLDLFTPSPMPPLPLRVLMMGTFNAYYDVPLMLHLVEELKRLIPTELVYAGPAEGPWVHDILALADETLEVDHTEIPALVRTCHVGLAVCRADAGVSLKAAMPTKLGELLACGRPVVVNAGLGDMDRLLADGSCGVTLSTATAEEVRQAALKIRDLVAADGTRDACRDLAHRHFDLERGIGRLTAIYNAYSGS